jgi:hypothetical protein
LEELKEDDQLLEQLRSSIQIYKDLTEIKQSASAV